MNIEKIWTVTFDEIHDGQCFEYNGLIFMKVYAYLDDAGNLDERRLAVNLNSGGVEDDWSGAEHCTLYNNAKVVLI